MPFRPMWASRRGLRLATFAAEQVFIPPETYAIAHATVATPVVTASIVGYARAVDRAGADVSR